MKPLISRRLDNVVANFAQSLRAIAIPPMTMVPVVICISCEQLRVPAIASLRRWMSHFIMLALVTLTVCSGATQAQDHEEAIVGYLGHLHCRSTTSGSDPDNLNVVYGVLVGYTDGSFRTWGGYVHYRKDVYTRFHQGPQLQQPLFVHSLLRTRFPTPIDTVIDQRQVQFVRVAVALLEYDKPPGLAQGRAGKQDINAQLRAVSWRRHAAELRGTEDRTVFCQMLRNAGMTSHADTIGTFEARYSASDLANRGKAYNAAVHSHLTAFSTPARRPTPENTLKDFRMTGDGSDYRGALWLTRGVRSIYTPSITDAVAASYTFIPLPAHPTMIVLNNRTPFDVVINIDSGAQEQDGPLSAGQRLEYLVGDRSSISATVTVRLPEVVAAGPEIARFRSALRRLPPLSATDGRQYELRMRGTVVEWFRLP